MSTILRSLAAANGARLRLGAGEPGLYTLLGGFGSSEEEGSFILGGGSSGAYSRITRLRADTRVAGGSPSTGGGTGSSGGGIGCAHIDMIVPGGKRMGDLRVEDVLELVDPLTGERRQGRVSYSETKLQPVFLVAWKNGVELVCSESAPIPTADSGYCTPLELCGEESLTELGGMLALSSIMRVQRLGEDWVQHVTVENACFLVGRHPGAYALHHNAKNTDIVEPGF